MDTRHRSFKKRYFTIALIFVVSLTYIYWLHASHGKMRSIQDARRTAYRTSASADSSNLREHQKRPVSLSHFPKHPGGAPFDWGDDWILNWAKHHKPHPHVSDLIAYPPCTSELKTNPDVAKCIFPKVVLRDFSHSAPVRRIPRVMVRSMSTKMYTRGSGHLFLAFLTSLTNNKDMDHILLDDADLQEFFNTHPQVPDEMRHSFFSIIGPGAAKADIFRATFLDIYGGIWQDVDTEIHDSVSNLISREKEEDLGHDPSFVCIDAFTKPAQWMMITAPSHPFVRTYSKFIARNVLHETCYFRRLIQDPQFAQAKLRPPKYLLGLTGPSLLRYAVFHTLADNGCHFEDGELAFPEWGIHSCGSNSPHGIDGPLPPCVKFPGRFKVSGYLESQQKEGQTHWTTENTEKGPQDLYNFTYLDLNPEVCEPGASQPLNYEADNPWQVAFPVTSSSKDFSPEGIHALQTKVTAVSADPLSRQLTPWMSMNLSAGVLQEECCTAAFRILFDRQVVLDDTSRVVVQGGAVGPDTRVQLLSKQPKSRPEGRELGLNDQATSFLEVYVTGLIPPEGNLTLDSQSGTTRQQHAVTLEVLPGFARSRHNSSVINEKSQSAMAGGNTVEIIPAPPRSVPTKATVKTFDCILFNSCPESPYSCDVIKGNWPLCPSYLPKEEIIGLKSDVSVVKDESSVGKSVADVQQHRPHRPGCVVYGMGLGWNVIFEREMIEMGCEVHAFDIHALRVNIPEHSAQHPTGAILHGYGIGDGILRKNMDEHGNRLNYFTLYEILVTLNHDRVSVWKLDCEGCEWGVFNQLQKEEENVVGRFDIVMVELHFSTLLGFNDTRPMEALNAFHHLFMVQNKFQIFWREENNNVGRMGNFFEPLRSLGLRKPGIFKVALFNRKTFQNGKYGSVK